MKFSGGKCTQCFGPKIRREVIARLRRMWEDNIEKDLKKLGSCHVDEEL
jgi:hypothetical protein